MNIIFSFVFGFSVFEYSYQHNGYHVLLTVSQAHSWAFVGSRSEWLGPPPLSPGGSSWNEDTGSRKGHHSALRRLWVVSSPCLQRLLYIVLGPVGFELFCLNLNEEKVPAYAFDSAWVREGSLQEAVALLFLEKGPALFVGIWYYFISKKFHMKSSIIFRNEWIYQWTEGACRVKVFLTCLNFDSVQGHDFFLLTVKAFIHFFLLLGNLFNVLN